MSAYFVIEPEVAGHIVDSIGDLAARPPRIEKLHYSFDGWLGDPIVESVGAYIVTAEMARIIERKKMTGIHFGDVEITTTDTFRDWYPEKRLPAFKWFKPYGSAGANDAGLDGLELVISDRLLVALRHEGLRHAQISRLDP